VKTKTVTLYMCGVDWQHEIGSAGDTVLYESLEDLKSIRKCVEGCGAVQIRAELTEVGWPIQQQLSEEAIS
jgi:hypothetical protein